HEVHAKSVHSEQRRGTDQHAQNKWQLRAHAIPRGILRSIDHRRKFLLVLSIFANRAYVGRCPRGFVRFTRRSPHLTYRLTLASTVASRVVSTGLTKCSSKPALRACLRSSSEPHPVNAMMVACFTSGSFRSRRATW